MIAKRSVFVLLLSFLLLLLTGNGCSLKDGDYLGPAERTARTLFFGWDMWDDPSEGPYDAPFTKPVEGTMNAAGKAFYEKALLDVEALSLDEQKRLSELTYRRYCYHCHGANGDGRIIVGESFGIRLPNLQEDNTQKLSDEEMFYQIRRGSENMIPLETTLSPRDTLLAIQKLRTFVDAPSVPFFTPKSTKPISFPPEM